MEAATQTPWAVTAPQYPQKYNTDTVAVLEIVIDGLSSKSVADAMRAGLKAVLDTGAPKGVTRITAGNYGGKLGQHHYKLRELLP